jgi:predicted DNA-binding protein (MmcQ/YjbR family)
MFALIREGKTPVQLSLKCDPTLSKLLREKYDEVMPGYHLNKKHWNTLVLSGQLEWPDVQGLIRLSHDLVLK